MHLIVDINWRGAGDVLRRIALRQHTQRDAFEESKHPRGQPKNKGQFAKGQGVAPSAAEPAVSSAAKNFQPKTREDAQEVGKMPHAHTTESLLKSLDLLLPSSQNKTDRKFRINIAAELLVRGIKPPKGTAAPKQPAPKPAPKVEEPAGATEENIPTEKPPLSPEATELFHQYSTGPAHNTEILTAFLKQAGPWYIRSWSQQALNENIDSNYWDADRLKAVVQSIPSSLKDTSWAKALNKRWLDRKAWEAEQPEAEEPEPQPEPAKPASKMADLPSPHPDSQPQKQLYNIATQPPGEVSNAEKVKQLKATTTYPGGHAETYKNTLIKALGGVPDEPAAPKPTPTPPPKPVSPPVVKPDNPPASWKALVARIKSALKGESNPNVTKAMPSDDKSLWMNSVKASVRNAVTSYTGAGYQQINKALRDPANASPSVVHAVHAIDEAFDSPLAKLDSDIMVYRGFALPDEVFTKLKHSLKLGLPTRFQQDGFISTSLKQSFAEGWGGPTKLEIMVKKETPALSVRRISNHPSENEVLLRHGQSFEVLEIEEIGSQRVIRCATV